MTIVIQAPVSDDLKARFWAKVEVGNADDCWLWIGSRSRNGYGVIVVDGRPIRAHRLSFAISTGGIRTDEMICHRCDNPSCVNPHHLFAGTQTDNMRDMVSKGRWRRGPLDRSKANYAKGERNPSARLTERDVLAIRSRRASGETQKVLADHYGVSPSLIALIEKRRIWKDVA